MISKKAPEMLKNKNFKETKNNTDKRTLGYAFEDIFSLTKKFAVFQRFPKVKNDGAILLPTLILSGMLLALALALTKIVSNELRFSADLLLAERAYFAAESGVEKSLLSLKTEPINWVDKTIDLENSATAEIMVFNAVDEFLFDLDIKETLRWRLGVDMEKSFDVQSRPVKDIRIDGNNIKDVLQWKIQCSDEGKNLLLQARAKKNKIDVNSRGEWDSGEQIASRTIFQFLKELSENARCYISLTNFGTEKISGIVKTDDKMAPAQTRVKAIGKAGGREKIIEFEYRQKNLDPFFDFGLLHQGR